MILHNIYNFLWTIAPPILRYYLRKRAKKNGDYSLYWGERFGVPYDNPVKNAIWIHAVSVGETRAALPLIDELQNRLPESRLLITQTTPTGRKTAQQLFANAQCRYLPYDNPKYIKQFLDEHAPKIAIFMETEIWVNLLDECKKRHIPTVLANARLSQKSLSGYLKFASLFRPAFSSLTHIFAQTAADAQRLKQVGAREITVAGNTKYDMPITDAMRQLAAEFRQKIGNRPVVLCASTREKDGVDEAKMLLTAWKKQENAVKNTLLVIVPRHPERFQTAYQYAQELGFIVQNRSDNETVNPKTQVWIGDSMGEMSAYCLCADLVFVGGSLVDTGCQNVIEPIICGKPVLFGFSTYNFAQATQDALNAGVARQVQTADEWGQTALQLLHSADEMAIIKQQTINFIHQHTGAARAMADEIVRIIQTH
ncbi:MAG: 3-deoxy-D-manno-octulosonic acid transferase [Neisseriaceae bacterium]|nr:3-deoxy-D-manno-octulosonic acid transferase [Neisseriaceae bacterium]